MAIIGAGAAGLQLLYEYTLRPSAKPLQILLIDSGNRSEKSWCFWQGASPIFEDLIEKLENFEDNEYDRRIEWISNQKSSILGMWSQILEKIF